MNYNNLLQAPASAAPWAFSSASMILPDSESSPHSLLPQKPHSFPNRAVVDQHSRSTSLKLCLNAATLIDRSVPTQVDHARCRRYYNCASRSQWFKEHYIISFRHRTNFCYPKDSKIITLRTISMALIEPAALPLFCCLRMIMLWRQVSRSDNWSLRPSCALVLYDCHFCTLRRLPLPSDRISTRKIALFTTFTELPGSYHNPTTMSEQRESIGSSKTRTQSASGPPVQETVTVAVLPPRMAPGQAPPTGIAASEAISWDEAVNWQHNEKLNQGSETMSKGRSFSRKIGFTTQRKKANADAPPFIFRTVPYDV